jgi:diamine N-acetyltransferase
MTVTFRTPGEGDAAAMAALGARAFTETFGHLYTPEDLALFLQNHTAEKWRQDLANPACAVRVGEAAGAAVGYAKLLPPDVPVTITAPAIELKQFYVLKEWHGTGVAQQLMNWAIQESRSRGAEELYLSVFIENERARRFYTRLGFKEVGRQKFMVGNHADEDIIMRKRL